MKKAGCYETLNTGGPNPWTDFLAEFARTQDGRIRVSVAKALGFYRKRPRKRRPGRSKS